MRNKINGYLGIFIGISLLSWLGYNYFIEMLPAAEGKNPIPALIISILSLYFGIKYLKKESNKNS